MKKYLLAFSFMLFAMSAAAQIISKTIDISTEGTLSTLLTATEKNTVTNLTITGKIDARDVKCLRDEMSQLAVLDIKSVSIIAYTGTDGTTSPISSVYPADEIPEFSFCNGTTGKTTLTKIYLSSTVASIGDSAFFNCLALTKLSVAAEMPPACQPNTFTGINLDNCVLEIPYGLNEVYPSQPYWEYFTIIVEKGIRELSGVTAGTLSSLLDADEKATIIKLTLSGEIDARDVKCMRDEMPVLSLLNIADVTINEYTGAAGPFGNINYTYPANEMPVFSFYDGTTGKTSLTNLKLPTTITSIGQSAFYKCTPLAVNLAIPNSVTSIGIYAFSGCSKLINEPLILPSNLTVIAEGAFELCSQIKGSLQIPNKVTTISNSAFRTCSGLTGTLTIPNSVSSIGYYAFENCLGFTKIAVLRDIPPTIQENTFNNIDKSGCILEVPIGAASAYHAANYWKDFTIIEKGLKAINLTSAGTLSSTLTADDKLNITNLIITGNLDARDIKCMRDEMAKISVLDISGANIVEYTGAGGTLSTTTTYPANEIPQNSFYLGSSNGRLTLTTIKLPVSLTSIGTSAFSYCENIAEMSIPHLVSTIGNNAFSNCRSLAGTLNIPNSIITIGDFAFSNCTNINKISVDNSVPPVIQSNTFQFVNKTTCTLEVPNGTAANYQAANYWKEFSNITVAVGLNTPLENNYLIRVIGRTIIIENTQNARISCYDCLGRSIILNKNSSDEFAVSKSGVYILCIGNYKTKIIVQ